MEATPVLIFEQPGGRWRETEIPKGDGYRDHFTFCGGVLAFHPGSGPLPVLVARCPAGGDVELRVAPTLLFGRC